MPAHPCLRHERLHHAALHVHTEPGLAMHLLVSQCKGGICALHCLCLGKCVYGQRTAHSSDLTDTVYLPQTDINENMRAILIDWLVEVHYKFKVRICHQHAPWSVRSLLSMRVFQIALHAKLCPYLLGPEYKSPSTW